MNYNITQLLYYKTVNGVLKKKLPFFTSNKIMKEKSVNNVFCLYMKWILKFLWLLVQIKELAGANILREMEGHVGWEIIV